MRYLSLVLVFLLATMAVEARSHVLLNDAPKDFTKKIETTVDKYKNIKIVDRCVDADGPKALSTVLTISRPEVVAFDVWTNDGKSLIERVVFKDDKEERLVLLNQGGCSHPGWEYTIVTPQKYDFKDVLKSVNDGLALLSDGQRRKIFTNKSVQFGENALSVAADRFSKNRIETVTVYVKGKNETRQEHVCRLLKFKKDKERILCGAYEDPDNYELVIDELPDGKTAVSLHYWNVL